MISVGMIGLEFNSAICELAPVIFFKLTLNNITIKKGFIAGKPKLNFLSSNNNFARP